MADYISAAYITAFAQLLGACAVTFGAWRSWKNGKAIEVVHHATNSMKDELVAAVRKASLAEGKAEGEASERADPQVPSK